MTTAEASGEIRQTFPFDSFSSFCHLSSARVSFRFRYLDRHLSCIPQHVLTSGKIKVRRPRHPLRSWPGSELSRVESDWSGDWWQPATTLKKMRMPPLSYPQKCWACCLHRNTWTGISSVKHFCKVQSNCYSLPTTSRFGSHQITEMYWHVIVTLRYRWLQRWVGFQDAIKLPLGRITVLRTSNERLLGNGFNYYPTATLAKYWRPLSTVCSELMHWTYCLLIICVLSVPQLSLSWHHQVSPRQMKPSWFQLHDIIRPWLGYSNPGVRHPPYPFRRG